MMAHLPIIQGNLIHALAPDFAPFCRRNHLGWRHVFRAFLSASGSCSANAAASAPAFPRGSARAIFQGGGAEHYRHSADGIR